MTTKDGRFEMETLITFNDESQERFWFLLSPKDIPKFSESRHLFLCHNLLHVDPASMIEKIRKINTCQYIDNDSDGIDWLLRMKGEILCSQSLIDRVIKLKEM